MPLVIGLAGGTGSGKTTVARSIKSAFSKNERVAIIEMDSYYKSFSHIPFDDRGDINYDHPDSIDFHLIKEQLSSLIQGKTIDKPVYDFVNHTRSDEIEKIEPADIIIFEGILAFFSKEIRELLSIKIFIDTDADIRILRRIRRDMEVRGRTFESVRKQYYDTVRPMHNLYVEPSKQFADIVIPEGGNYDIAIDMIVSKIKHWLSERKN